ncbi:MAG: iron-sulfur cluster assembly accessory protein [Verrucomicrobiaceae bacterium]|nr:iron-sulfur cluster assembly accessory protein [Verrucomicrobiaceae bacterium]
MITLTSNAIAHLKNLLVQHNAGAGTGLRLHVDKGGCAGMQYTMRIDSSHEGDEVFTTDGVSIIVDAASLTYLDGSCVDFVEALNDSGFKIENPNAARSCGCGTSFEPRGTESGD